jgi:HEAT repeat protein
MTNEKNNEKKTTSNLGKLGAHKGTSPLGKVEEKKTTSLLSKMEEKKTTSLLKKSVEEAKATNRLKKIEEFSKNQGGISSKTLLCLVVWGLVCFLGMRAYSLFSGGDEESIQIEKRDSNDILLRLLRQKTPGIRGAAIETFKKMGPVAIPVLLEEIPLAEVELQKEIFKIIGSYKEKGESAKEPLLRLLKNEGSELFSEVLKTLQSIGIPPKEMIVALELALKNTNEQVRIQAIRALRELEIDLKEIFPALERLLKDPQGIVRLEVVKSLSDTNRFQSKSVLKALQSVLKDESPEVCAEAVRGLGKLGEEAQGTKTLLLELLQKKEVKIDKAVLEALGLIRAEGKEVVFVLMESLKSSDEEIRSTARVALRQIGKVEEAIPELSQALKAKETMVRKEALRTLGEINAHQVLPEMLPLLTDPEWEVCEEALFALLKIAENPALILKRYESNLSHPSPEIRLKALTLLGKIKNRALTVPFLIKALEDSQLEIRKESLKSLEEIGSEAVSAVPALLKVLTDSQLTQEVRNTLSKIASCKEMIPLFIKALEHEEMYVRHYAVKFLGESGVELSQILPPLKEAFLKESKWQIREEITKLFGQFKTPEVLPLLIEALKDKNWSVRKAACDALKMIGSDAEIAVPALKEALQDSIQSVREKANEALKTIQK